MRKDPLPSPGGMALLALRMAMPVCKIGVAVDAPAGRVLESQVLMAGYAVDVLVLSGQRIRGRMLDVLYRRPCVGTVTPVASQLASMFDAVTLYASGAANPRVLLLGMTVGTCRGDMCTRLTPRGVVAELRGLERLVTVALRA